MQFEFDGLCVPDWTFDLEEVSNNVFRLSGKHILGPCVEVKGDRYQSASARGVGIGQRTQCGDSKSSYGTYSSGQPQSWRSQAKM